MDVLAPRNEMLDFQVLFYFYTQPSLFHIRDLIKHTPADMKSFRKIFAFLALLQLQVVFAQWHQLPAVTSYSPNAPFTLGAFGQTAVMPVANGKLFHARYLPYGAHSADANFMYSNDDLQNSQCLFCPLPFHTSMSSSQFVFDICSASDSVISLCHQTDGAVRFRFSFDGFTTSSISGAPGNGLFVSQCITSHYLYFVYRIPFSGQDSLYFRRSNGTPSVVTIKLSAWRSSALSESKPQRLLFVNDSTGYFLTNSRANPAKTVIIKTTDYGQNWSEIAADSINPIKAYYFVSTGTGYLLKTDGSIHKTTNGGLNWTPVTSPSAGSLNCINFYDAQYGYVGGNNGALWKTTDGGNSWSAEQGTGSKAILDISTFASGLAYCMNSDHDVFKNQADVVGINKVDPDFGEATIYPNPASKEITLDLSVLKQRIRNISLVNVLGQILYSSDPDNTQQFLIIPVDGLQNGSYFIVLRSDEKVVRKKITVIR